MNERFAKAMGRASEAPIEDSDRPAATAGGRERAQALLS
jgi:hypothetical protein